MKQRWTARLLCLVGLLGGLAGALVAADRVEPEGNIPGGRLAGDWVPAAAFAASFGNGHPPYVGLSFRDDARVPALVDSRYRAFVSRKRIHAAGIVTLPQADCPYLLIEHNGNPYLLYFRKGPRGAEAEGHHLMLVPAKNPSGDLLFVGGIGAGDPFHAYRRKAH